MTKKKTSTYDAFVKKLNPQAKKEFDKEYFELLLSEMLIAAMNEEDVSIRKLAQEAGVSPTIIQGIRSGTRKNVSMKSFFKILDALGCSIVIEKNGSQFLLPSFSAKKN